MNFINRWTGSMIYAMQNVQRNYLSLQLLAIVSLFSWLLYIAMRRNLVLSLHNLYFSKRVFYKLNAIDNEGIDNPWACTLRFSKNGMNLSDQRITQDCERMCNILAKQVLPYLLISPGVICYYSVVTWKKYPNDSFNIWHVFFVELAGLAWLWFTHILQLDL